MEEKQVHSQLTLLYLVISKGNVTTYILHHYYTYGFPMLLNTELNFYWNEHMIYTWTHVRYSHAIACIPSAVLVC